MSLIDYPSTFHFRAGMKANSMGVELSSVKNVVKYCEAPIVAHLEIIQVYDNSFKG